MICCTWWRHQMEIFSALLAFCKRNSPAIGGFPYTKASDAELWCFIWSAPEQTIEQRIETPVIWDAIAIIMTSLWCIINTHSKIFRIKPWYQGLYSLSGKTSYRKISWSLEAAGFGFKLFQSLWNLAGTSAELLPRCLSNFRAIRPLQHPISRLRDFTRFGGKASYRWVNRSPG